MLRIRRTGLSLTTTIGLLAALVAANIAGTMGVALAAPSHRGSTPTTSNLASLVNPLTGTGVQQGAVFGGGDTFPGADVPFGMVQWSPDTVSMVSGGYDYNDTRIKGFSLTHLNGAGCGVYGDIPFMPFVGAVTDSPASDPNHYISTFSHSNESASAGYYQVTLDNGAKTELTATQRSGAGRFTYPAGQTATMLVNASGSANGTSDAQVDIGKNTISGWATSGGFCGANDTYRVYFWAQFSQPFATTGTWHNAVVTPGSATARGGSPTAPAVQQVTNAKVKTQRGVASPAEVKQAQSNPDTTVSGPGSGAYVTFDTSKGTAISVNVGLSFVSVSNAQSNVSTESKGSFDQTLQQAQQTWNHWLGMAQVSGGTSDQQITFYTALYHALLQPNVFSDVNGQYIGFDGQTHTVAKGHAQYANFSGWDIYRSEAQLLALLAPNETSDIMQSMVNDYTQGGMLPKWTLANAETYIMVGDPADAIIADAYAFGATNFDTKTALAAMIKQATQQNNIRPGLNYLDSLGYEPNNGGYGCCNFYGPASTTLEYNTADFAIGQFAQALGDTANYQKFQTRAQDWENLLNPATANMPAYLEPRNMDGSFPSPYTPSSQSNWVEGNGAQYNWMVPFDLQGLFNAFGGNGQVTPRLDTFFTQLNAGPDKPYAFLGNEPTLETPWEYDYAGAPYKTQSVVRQVVNTLYAPGPGGLAGNDDLGEMSSWYVFAAMGMYPETPGTADLALASPLFTGVTLHRESGQTIQINAPGASASTPYVQSLAVNGQPSSKPWLPASFVAQGGTLDYTLSSTANTAWGSDPHDAPPSYRSGEIPTRVSLNPGRVVAPPGGAAATVELDGQNISGAATTVSWSATPPAGLTVSPSSGSFAVAAGGSGNESFTVTAAANMAYGYYTIAIAAQTADGTKLPGLTLNVVVAQPGSPLATYNNAGITDDSNTGAATFDGGGWSYSQQALAAAGIKPGGSVSVGGLTYTWPNVPVAQPDNIMANGQTVNVTGAAGATSLGFLGSATNGSASGAVTITYSDNSTQTATIGFSDWTLGGGGQSVAFGNVIAAQMPYRNYVTGKDSTTTYLFATAPIALQPGKQIQSVTLPGASNSGVLHVFAIAVGTPAGAIGTLYNNAGISDDSNQGSANFDGVGFSYSEQALTKAGYGPGATVTPANGMTYTWPNVAAGQPDNVIAYGQTVQLPNAKAGASRLAFLGSATNGPSQGTITITYTDGTTQTAQLGLSDWTLGAGASTPSFGNVIAAQLPYRNSIGGSSQQIGTYVLATAPISLDTSKTVASVTLPSSVDQGALHIFAIAVG